nr:hypothetical protein [Tanacetum cinerariifolium]
MIIGQPLKRAIILAPWRALRAQSQHGGSYLAGAAEAAPARAQQGAHLQRDALALRIAKTQGKVAQGGHGIVTQLLVHVARDNLVAAGQVHVGRRLERQHVEAIERNFLHGAHPKLGPPAGAALLAGFAPAPASLLGSRPPAPKCGGHARGRWRCRRTHAAAIGQLLAVEIQLVANHQPKQAAEQRRNVAARHPGFVLLFGLGQLGHAVLPQQAQGIGRDVAPALPQQLGGQRYIEGAPLIGLHHNVK